MRQRTPGDERLQPFGQDLLVAPAGCGRWRAEGSALASPRGQPIHRRDAQVGCAACPTAPGVVSGRLVPGSAGVERPPHWARPPRAGSPWVTVVRVERVRTASMCSRRQPPRGPLPHTPPGTAWRSPGTCGRRGGTVGARSWNAQRFYFFLVCLCGFFGQSRFRARVFESDEIEKKKEESRSRSRGYRDRRFSFVH